MNASRARTRWLLVTAVLVAAWLLPEVPRRWLERAFAEFTGPVKAQYGQAKDLRAFWRLRSHSKRELMAAGRDLARINAAYAVSQQRLTDAEAEVTRLEALLALPSEPEFRYEVARVAQRQYTAWWERIVIRKGRQHQLAPGQAVVSADGVVGRIREVQATTATVELVSSPGFRMAAIVEGLDYPVTYQGLPNAPLAPPQGEVLNVPPEIRADDARSLRLVSSRLGGIFPAGLTIGTITTLEPGADGYFQRGTVALPRRLASLREVAVIVPVVPAE